MAEYGKLTSSMDLFRTPGECEGVLLLRVTSVEPLQLTDVVAERFDSLGSPRLTFKQNMVPLLESYRQKLFAQQPGFTFYARARLDKRFPARSRQKDQLPKSFWEGYMTSDIVSVDADATNECLGMYAAAHDLEFEHERHVSLMERFLERSQNPNLSALPADALLYPNQTQEPSAEMSELKLKLEREQEARQALERRVDTLQTELQELRQIVDQRFEAVREAWSARGG